MLEGLGAGLIRECRNDVPASDARRAGGIGNMTGTNRRTFLGAAGALALAGRAAWADPGERVRVAVIGVRGRGTDLAREFAANKGSEVVAVCDIDDASFPKAVQAV